MPCTPYADVPAPPPAQAVVSDVPTCGGVAYAQSHSIPTLTFPAPKKGGFPGLTTEELVQQLTQQHKADIVLLAGFLKVGWQGRSKHPLAVSRVASTCALTEARRCPCPHAPGSCA
jgi:hypothetical protein